VTSEAVTGFDIMEEWVVRVLTHGRMERDSKKIPSHGIRWDTFLKQRARVTGMSSPILLSCRFLSASAPIERLSDYAAGLRGDRALTIFASINCWHWWTWLVGAVVTTTPDETPGTTPTKLWAAFVLSGVGTSK
jgi:hypothetical protein